MSESSTLTFNNISDNGIKIKYDYNVPAFTVVTELTNIFEASKNDIDYKDSIKQAIVISNTEADNGENPTGEITINEGIDDVVWKKILGGDKWKISFE
jgi:hypothetical protein